MFVNGEALARALWLVPILAAVFLTAIVTHVVWIVQFARSPVVRGYSGPTRVLLVALALTTPILSFYAVQIASWWQHRATIAARRDARLVAVAAVLTFTAAAAASAYDTMRHVQSDRTLHNAADAYINLVLLIIVVQLVLAMAARVLAGRDGLVWGWALLAAASAVILIIVV